MQIQLTDVLVIKYGFTSASCGFYHPTSTQTPGKAWSENCTMHRLVQPTTSKGGPSRYQKVVRLMAMAFSITLLAAIYLMVTGYMDSKPATAGSLVVDGMVASGLKSLHTQSLHIASQKAVYKAMMRAGKEMSVRRLSRHLQ